MSKLSNRQFIGNRLKAGLVGIKQQSLTYRDCLLRAAVDRIYSDYNEAKDRAKTPPLPVVVLIAKSEVSQAFVRRSDPPDDDDHHDINIE